MLPPIACNLVAHRRRCGWSQEHLAEATGLSTRTIQRIETGKTANPNSETLLALADAFDLDVYDLLLNPTAEILAAFDTEYRRLPLRHVDHPVRLEEVLDGARMLIFEAAGEQTPGALDIVRRLRGELEERMEVWPDWVRDDPDDVRAFTTHWLSTLEAAALGVGVARDRRRLLPGFFADCVIAVVYPKDEPVAVVARELEAWERQKDTTRAAEKTSFSV